MWHSDGSAEKLPRILCMVAYDSGYDVSNDGAVQRLHFPYNYIMLAAAKLNYGVRPGPARLQGRCRGNALLSPTTGISDTYRAIKRLSGIPDSCAWLDKQQPRLDDISVPSLLVNSRDDPINTWTNVEHYLKDIAANPNLALAEMQCGAHGCKYDFWGFSSVINTMVTEFVMASWKARHGANDKCP
jgi:hypothetical protein